jgi:N-acylneuraminate cytidylyltransferase/CMP-N,N'-diacetyllegionaminic acid synthase
MDQERMKLRLCTICARGGSKGVPDKNVRLMLGQPLIAHTVRQALDSGLFDAVAVSSDSPRILEAADVAGANFLIQRPDELATDQADKSSAMVHCAQEVERMTRVSYDTFVDLDATAPLRRIFDIVKVVQMIEENDYTNVYSVCPSRRSPYYNMVEVDAAGTVRLVKQLNPPIERRQDAPATYDMNASIYAWSRTAFMDGKAAVHMANTQIYIMPEETVFDIDSEIDFKIVEMLLPRFLGNHDHE